LPSWQVEAYLASQPGPKQADLRRLHAHILAEFPGCRLWFSGAGTVTVELAVTWARLPAGIKPITADFRLSEVRGFARYLHAIDPAHEVPPPGLLGVPRRRPAPYIYTPGQIAEILRATQRLQPPLRAATYRTLLGLLAATGMRLGEATALTRAGVGLAEAMVTLRYAKSGRIRLVPPCTRRSPLPSVPTPPRGTGSAPPRGSIGSSCPSPGGPCGGERLTRSSG